MSVWRFLRWALGGLLWHIAQWLDECADYLREEDDDGRP